MEQRLYGQKARTEEQIIVHRDELNDEITDFTYRPANDDWEDSTLEILQDGIVVALARMSDRHADARLLITDPED